VVLCVDEKSRVQALARTAPVLPVRPGIPEKQTRDYVRHGTTTLFAALEAAAGKVTDACCPRHRHEEFLRFLRQVAKACPRTRLHIVADNFSMATDIRHAHRRPGHEEAGLEAAQPATASGHRKPYVPMLSS
jgi:hypothetical protein